MNKKYIIFSVIIIAVVIVGIFIIKGKIYQPSPSPLPTDGSDVSPTPSLTSEPSTSPVSDEVPKCWLTGEIVYDGEVFKHIGTQELNYDNLLDPHDIIKWQISPSAPFGTDISGETFSIGPNRASGLKLPKGSDYLTISFNGLTPKYSQYDLTASIDYVAVVDNAAKILNEKCSGKAILKINK